MIKWLLLTTVLLSGQKCNLVNDFFIEKELKRAVIFDCYVNINGTSS